MTRTKILDEVEQSIERTLARWGGNKTRADLHIIFSGHYFDALFNAWQRQFLYSLPLNYQREIWGVPFSVDTYREKGFVVTVKCEEGGLGYGDHTTIETKGQHE